MKKLSSCLLFVLALTIVFHVAFVYFLPDIIMNYVIYRIQNDFDIPTNTVYHNEVVNSDTRKVVRPCPDLLYSGMAYDVSERPVRIMAPVPPSYWSASFFAINTDNFYVMNDRTVKGGYADVVLVKKNAPYPVPKNTTVVVAPSPRGVILFRTSIDSPSRIPLLIGYQKKARAEALDP